MQDLVKKHKNKLSILLIIVSPIIVAVCNVLVLAIFNLGTYVGTFLRFLYKVVVG